MPQLDLQLGNRPQPADVDDSVLLKKPTFLSALAMCKDVSGLSDDEIASLIEMDPSQFSKCFSKNRNGKSPRHFPPDNIPKLMAVCKNKIPARWLALHGGDELKPMLSTIEEELVSERAKTQELEQKLETITEFMRRTRQ